MNNRDRAIELIKEGVRFKDISSQTDLSLNAVKKLSQMLKLYEKVDNVVLSEFLKDLKHDALLFNRFKTKETLVGAVKYVMSNVNCKPSRAQLKSLLDGLGEESRQVEINDKYEVLLGQIKFLKEHYTEEDLDRIGLVANLDGDHNTFFVLKYKIQKDVRDGLIQAGALVYDEKTYYYYAKAVVYILDNLSKISFGERHRKPLDLDPEIVIEYMKKNSND